jgi:hypothetical protein
VGQQLWGLLQDPIKAGEVGQGGEVGLQGGLGGQVALSQVLALQQEKNGQGQELGQGGFLVPSSKAWMKFGGWHTRIT